MDLEPQRDLEHEHPIPAAWRPVFRSIASAIAAGDLMLTSADPQVKRLLADDAEAIRHAIDQYGNVTVTELSDATWEYSAASWQGTHWETVVDLCTVEEGLSDLGLHTVVRETPDGFTFEVDGVWVE